ncbi:MAG: cell division protein FtsA, partial [Pseudomonadota bacterium]|nr:cell division protein FtsA [Pseudomonadota bacterium]
PRAVLTGGGAMLTGARELAQHMIERQVRMGRPIRLSGLPEASAGPAFSSCAGLIAYKKRRSNDMLPATPNSPYFFGKVGKWLKRNF